MVLAHDGDFCAYNDLPKDELLLHANKTLEKMGPKAKIYFKYTCNKCGARANLSEPNVLYEQGECCVCGHVQNIVSGGYTLICEI